MKEWTLFKSYDNLSCKEPSLDTEDCRSYCEGVDACEGFHYDPKDKKCCAKNNIDEERIQNTQWYSGLRKCSG